MKNLKSIFKQTICLAVATVAGLFFTGCAQVMAIRQPRPFTPGCLTVGERRLTVVGELGQPATTEEHGDHLTEVYKYTDGGAKNNGLSKTARVIIYTGGDIFTAWLDQVVWMPMEAFGFAGTRHAVTIDFGKAEDASWRINKMDDRVLKGRSSKSDGI